MSHSEFSFSFSVAQLLGLKVCLDFTNVVQPPNMSFEPFQNAHPASHPDAAGGLIKLETLLIDGRRVLRLYAVDPSSSTSAMSSLESTPSSSTAASPLSVTSPLRNTVSHDINAEVHPVYDPGFFAVNTDMQPENTSHGFFTDMPELDRNFFAASLGDLDGVSSSLVALGCNFEALGLSIGSPDANQPMPSEVDLSRVGLAPQAFNRSFFGMHSDMQCHEKDISPNQTSFMSMPEINHTDYFSGSLRDLDHGVPLSSQSVDAFGQYPHPHPDHIFTNCRVQDDMDSNSGSATSSMSPHSHSNRSTPELDAGNQGQAECGASSSSSSPSSTHSASSTLPKRRKRSSRKTPSQFIYHCPHPSCSRVFRSEYTCRVHSGVHNPKPRKVVHCTELGCEETFTRQHDRLRHEVSQHGKVCEWSCSMCHRFFSSDMMLQKHKCPSSNNR